MDFIVEYLPYAVVAIVFYNIGSHIRAFQIMMNLSKDPERFIGMMKQIKDINESVDEGMPEDAIEVETEQVNNLVYAYNKLTGEFLAQAQNLHQVMTLAAARYPGKKFWHPELKQDNQTA
jgi:hypothetical protein